MTTPLQKGSTTWVHLSETFASLLEMNTADFSERAQFWAGFVGSSMGAMAADIGVEAVHAIVEGALKSADQLAEKHERKH